MRHHNEVIGQPQGRMACVLKKVIAIEHQYKDLILRSLTFVRDDIEMEGRSGVYRATWVPSRPLGEISSIAMPHLPYQEMVSIITTIYTRRQNYADH